VLFDAYGTLFDVYSVGLIAEQLFPGQGQHLSVLWRDKQIEYTRLVTTSNHGAHYQPFWELTRAALRYACKRLKLALTPEIELQLMNQYRHLSAFPENRDVLQALQARGIKTGILSNGNHSSLTVEDCVFQDNTSKACTVITNESEGAVTVIRCSFLR